VAALGGSGEMDTISHDPVPARDSNLVLGDSYIVGRRIGRGAMGDVYEAQHVRLPGQFAVKLLLPELQGNQEAFARFCREAEIMSQLRHPNIVQIFDFNVAPDARPYFVMEYLEGRDLEARLQGRPRPMPLPTVTRIVDAVASALALAHAHGVVHRDLKPANIFLATVDGQTDELVKVLDFGISKVRSAAAQISQAVDLLGTPSYMAPEQARGQTDAIDGRTDQFALAAITYRMLTGQEPFQGDDTAAVLYQVVHEDPPPLSLFLPMTWNTEPLQSVLGRALAKQPERRFGGMMELARAFDDAAERTIGTGNTDLAVEARRARGIAARPLDDADIDPPPPVRTPTPVVVSPPRRLPTPTPRPRPPQILDWEMPPDIDKVPVSRARGAVLGLLLLAIAATLIATGWYKRLPAAASAARQKIHEWTGPRGAASPPGATEAVPQTAAPEDQQAPPQPAAPDTTTGDAPPAPPAAAPAAQTPPPAAAPAPVAAPEKPRAHSRPKVRSHRENARRFAAPPPPADRDGTIELAPPTTPPLDGRAFEIAPPTPMERRRDLAPPSGGGDDTLPLSP
jgi:eukaryotic-like serine/threonine-protein kinase